MKRLERIGLPLLGALIALAVIAERALVRRAVLANEGFIDADWTRALELGALLLHPSSAGVSWAPWDVAAAIGPLRQLMGATAVAIGRTSASSPEDVVVHATVALSALSVGLAALGALAVARALPASPRMRWGFGLLVLIFAARVDLDAPVGLALLWAALELARPRPRAIVALLVLALAAAFDPQAAVFGIALLVVGLPLSRLRQGDALGALERGGSLALGLLGVLLAHGATLVSRSDSRALEIAAPLTALSEPAPDGQFLLLAILLGLIVLAPRSERDAHVVSLSLVPPALLTLVGLGPALVGLWPFAAIATTAGSRWPRTTARVGVGVLALAALVPTMRALVSPPSLVTPSQRSDGLVLDWIASRDASDCVARVGSLGAVSVALARTGGDPQSTFDAREPRGSSSQQLADGRCAWAVARFDPHAADHGLRDATWPGRALLELGRNYALERELGRSTRALRRRDAPWPISVRREVHEPAAETRLAWDRPLHLTLDAPTPLSALIDVEYELSDAGPAPMLYVHGARVPVRAGRHRVVVPVSAERAAIAWTRGTPEPERFVDRLTLRSLRDVDGARLVVHSLRVHVPEPIPWDIATAGACDAGPLDDAGTTHGGLADGLDVRLFPTDARDATFDVPLRPCPEHCLLLEAGLEAGEGPVAFQVTYEDGAVEGLASERSIGVGWRQPFEIPLRVGPGHLRFRARGPLGTELRLRQPRLQPCVSPYSLLHASHEWVTIVPSEAEVTITGDEIRIPAAATGAIPIRVEVALTVPRDGRTCVAVEVAPRDATAPVGAILGVRRDRSIHRLHRGLLAPDASPIALRDLELTEWAGEDLWLVLSTWSTLRNGGGAVTFVRAQLHPCGEPTRWSFGGQ